MKTYRPSGIAPVQGILIALVLAAITGLIAGGLLWFADHKIGFYLILLFPAVAGLIVGFGTSGGTSIGKLRNPLLAGLIALLGGALAGWRIPLPELPGQLQGQCARGRDRTNHRECLGRRGATIRRGLPA